MKVKFTNLAVIHLGGGCIIPALLLSLWRFKYSIVRGLRTAGVRWETRPGFLVSPEWPLKRKNAGNNFFCTKNAKIMKKLLVIKK